MAEDLGGHVAAERRFDDEGVRVKFDGQEAGCAAPLGCAHLLRLVGQDVHLASGVAAGANEADFVAVLAAADGVNGDDAAGKVEAAEGLGADPVVGDPQSV
ncbi:hypothetical protein ABZ642_40415 [Streptomyces sp. NPDC007157]|uniref:hypothetical protein n=1 Tax=Streptomyces sp. NPDC007157 TaxID=3154681 RepID=UPI00340AE783